MLIELTINACFMAKFAMKGGFLKDFDFNKSQEEFLAAEILRHSIQIFMKHSRFTKSNLIEFADVIKMDPKSNDFQLYQFETLDPLIRMVKYSCDPNISILSVDGDGNKSNISVFFATRPIPAGSTLTTVLSAYGSWVRVRLYPFQLAYKRKRKYFQELGLPCPCPKCLLEQQDNPFGSNGIEYYPIACADCHGLFTRKVPSGPFKCSKCNRQASASEMKKAYTTIKVLEAQANLLIESIGNDFSRYVDYYQSMIELELLVTEKICPLLYGGAYLFASLFERLSRFYRDYALDNPDNFALYFRKAWMYAEKALCTFEQYDYGHECVSVFVLLNVMVDMFGDTLDDEHFEDRFSKGGMPDIGKGLLERFRVIKQRALKMKELYKFI